MLTENIVKGLIVELQVQIELLRYGFDISIPTYNASRYDLIADTGRELLKIQVKKSSVASNTSFKFPCTTQNTQGAHREKHKYTTDEVDYFATVWNNQVYLVPVDETSNEKTIRFDDETYLAKNVLSSYQRYSDEDLYTSNAVKHYCEICGAELHDRKARICKSCWNKIQSQNIPSREEVKEMIRTTPFTTIGEKYGVTDNAIRRWCDKYGLPRKRREIEKYSQEEWEKL